MGALYTRGVRDLEVPTALASRILVVVHSGCWQQRAYFSPVEYKYNSLPPEDLFLAHDIFPGLLSIPRVVREDHVSSSVTPYSSTE